MMLKIAARIVAFAGFAASVSLSPVSSAMVINQMFVFGDSLSDPGNAAALTQLAPGVSLFPPSQPNLITGNPAGIPYDYRFSNGPTTMEQLASLLGTGTSAPAWISPANSNPNFAVGGAMTGQGPIDPSLPGIAGAGLCCNYNWLTDSPGGVQSIPAVQLTGINNQIDLFASRLGSSVPAFDPATTLFSVWGGPNDIFLALALAQGLPADQQAAILQAYTFNAAGNIGKDIQALAALNGKNFLVPNMPNLGETPFGLSLDPTLQAELTGISQAYNGLLDEVSAQLEHDLHLNIVEFDTFGALDDVIHSGIFANTTQPCLDTSNPPGSINATLPNVLGGCQGFLFFDSVHPTVATSEILAEEMRAAVPEPNVLALLAAALLAFVGSGFLRRHR
jgi:phospholipase/lecithinase/hemolysin